MSDVDLSIISQYVWQFKPPLTYKSWVKSHEIETKTDILW